MMTWVDSTHLNRIEETISCKHAETEKRLTVISAQLEKLITMATTQAQFDQELADSIADISQSLTNGQAAIDTAVQAIIDAVNAGKSPADLTTEFNTLETARQAFKAAIAAIPGQLPTTPTPPPQNAQPNPPTGSAPAPAAQ